MPALFFPCVGAPNAGNSYRISAESMKELDTEKLKLLYERFRDVCLVEKEVWKEIYLPRDVKEGAVRRTNVQDRYEVTIDDPEVEAVIEANIELGPKALDAAISEYRSAISFEKA